MVQPLTSSNMNYYKCFLMPVMSVFLFCVIYLLTEIPAYMMEKMNYIDDQLDTHEYLFDDESQCNLIPLEANPYYMILFNELMIDLQRHYERMDLLITGYVYLFVGTVFVNVYNILVFVIRML